ncbi:MAG TPA: hypothetical protein DCZ97_15875 [Syntrophus sp. (in: bacteria)]|nr:hypothetical protein [Syntrophus sp. (in: bacteria)]
MIFVINGPSRSDTGKQHRESRKHGRRNDSLLRSSDTATGRGMQPSSSSGRTVINFLKWR